MNPEPRVIEVVLEGQPRAKSRHRTTKSGGVYTPAETQEHEQAIGWALRAVIRGDSERFLGNVRVEATFYRSNKQRIDVDNLLKAVLDGANGIAWVDDVQVTSIAASLHLDRERPRTEIRIQGDCASSMPRGNNVDLVGICETCGTEFTYRVYDSLPPQRFCSNKCVTHGHASCAQCGESFTRRGTQLYCSEACSSAARLTRQRAAWDIRRGPLGSCMSCGCKLKTRGASMCTDCYRKGLGRRKAKLTTQPKEEG